jgi:dipeptidyl-peptidase 4
MTCPFSAVRRPARWCLLVAAFALMQASAGAEQTVARASRRLTVERIAASPSLTGIAPSSLQWSPDSRRLAFLWNDEARPQREIWVVAVDGGPPVRLTSTDGASGSVSEFTWTNDGAGVVYLRNGEVYHLPAAGGAPSQLTHTRGSKSSIGVSPDGRFVSWLQDGDLWLRNQQTGDAVQATHVGMPGPGTIPLGTYNRPDVEFGRYVWGGGVPAYLWSPDSRLIALHYVDRREVRKVPFPYYLEEETTANVLRRGYPGDHDEVRTIALYTVNSGTLRMLPFPDQGWRHINGYAWSEDNRLLIDQLTDTQQDRWLHVADAVGTVTTIWHDHRESRVYSAFEAAWAADPGQVLMVGDLDDRYRLYAVQSGSTAPKALTPPGFDVSDIVIAGRGTERAIFFTSNQKSPYERHVYRMPVRGGAMTAITKMPGTHQPTVSPDGSTIALLHSSDTTPTDLYLVDAAGRRPERRVTTSPPPEFAEYRWAVPHYVTFKSRIDGFTLHARVLEPPDRDPNRRYPVIFGPVYSNTVRNRWAGANATLQQFLAVERGYIVVQVDVRGSTGYGRDFREQFLMDYGGKDLDDLQSALEHLGTLPYADTQRAGIWGSSYGGLLTTYMLFKKPGLFKAGVAAAAAVDPRFFGVDDVAITRLPNTHPEAYRRGAAANYARNLQDPLLFIHGMQDDVVPFKTIVDLMEQLMLLGKDFDVAIAPAATHGWSQREHYATFLYRKLVNHFDRHLALKATPAPATPRTPPGGRR